MCVRVRARARVSNHDQATEPCHRIITMRIGMHVCMYSVYSVRRGYNVDSISVGRLASKPRSVLFLRFLRTPSGGRVAEETWRKPGHQQVASPFEEGKGYYPEIRSFEFDGLLIDPTMYSLFLKN